MSKFTEDFKNAFWFKPSDLGNTLGALATAIVMFLVVALMFAAAIALFKAIT